MRKFIFALIALCGLATYSEACDPVVTVFRARSGGCIPSQQLLVERFLVREPVVFFQEREVVRFRSFNTFEVFDAGARVRVRAPGVRVIVR